MNAQTSEFVTLTFDGLPSIYVTNGEALALWFFLLGLTPNEGPSRFVLPLLIPIRLSHKNQLHQPSVLDMVYIDRVHNLDPKPLLILGSEVVPIAFDRHTACKTLQRYFSRFSQSFEFPLEPDENGAYLSHHRRSDGHYPNSIIHTGVQLSMPDGRREVVFRRIGSLTDYPGLYSIPRKSQNPDAEAELLTNVLLHESNVSIPRPQGWSLAMSDHAYGSRKPEGRKYMKHVFPIRIKKEVAMTIGEHLESSHGTW